VTGFCEDGDESWDSIKGREFIGQLSDYQLFSNNSFA
jgi:hypothetical protein